MDREAALRQVEDLAQDVDALTEALATKSEELRDAVRVATALDVSQAELSRRSGRHRNTIKIWIKE